MQHEDQRSDAANSVDGDLAAAYGAELDLAAELTAQLTSPAAVEGAVDLTFERRRESGALLWVVEYGGYLVVLERTQLTGSSRRTVASAHGRRRAVVRLFIARTRH
jgi:hypothetical protein